MSSTHQEPKSNILERVHLIGEPVGTLAQAVHAMRAANARPHAVGNALERTGLVGNPVGSLKQAVAAMRATNRSAAQHAAGRRAAWAEAPSPPPGTVALHARTEGTEENGMEHIADITVVMGDGLPMNWQVARDEDGEIVLSHAYGDQDWSSEYWSGWWGLGNTEDVTDEVRAAVEALQLPPVR